MGVINKKKENNRMDKIPTVKNNTVKVNVMEVGGDGK